MKNKLLFKLIAAIALFWVLPFGAKAQVPPFPTYQLEILNDVQLTAKTYQFDIYIKWTGSTYFEFGGLQAGFTFNTAALASGATLTPTVVAGGYEVNACNQNVAANLMPFPATGATTGIKMTLPGTLCGQGNGTMISSAGYGTRVIRILLTSSANFVANQQLSLAWNYNTEPWPTSVFAYLPMPYQVPAINPYRNITNQSSSTTAHANNPVLNPSPVVSLGTVSGTATICQGGTAYITLLNSTSGQQYQLYNGTTAVGTPKGGVAANAGLVWAITNATAGTYTVKKVSGSTLQNGSAVITVIPYTTPTFAQLGPYCQNGTSEALPLISENSISGSWYLNNPPAINPVSGPISTAIAASYNYMFTPAWNEGCVNHAAMTVAVNAGPEAAGSIYGNAAVAEGAMGEYYSTDELPSATSYVWTYTGPGASHVTITPGTNGFETYLDFGAGSAGAGQLHVYGVNDCGQGVESFFDIFVEASTPPPTAFDVSGGGSYCEGVPVGQTVTLANSEIGVTYDLYVDPGSGPVAVGAPWAGVAGTGLPINFGPLTAPGTYTVTGTNVIATVPMNLSAVISVTPALTLTNSIGVSANNICEGTSVDFSCTHNYPVASCDWYVNGSLYYTGMNLMGYVPAVGDIVWCVCHVTSGCWTSQIAESNHIPMQVTPLSTVNETASACDSYTWPYNNTTYYASDVITVVEGCVTHVLHLTITPSSTVNETASACDSYTWPYNNTTYYASDVITVVDGCVSHVLHLTITPSSTVNETASACDSYTWPYNNITYYASDVITVVEGCVSHVLHLTITPSSTVNETASACDSYTWPYNNITYYASDVITVVEGCVSHVLHLTITPSSTVNETASACDSYTWPYNNTTYYASDVITVVDGCVSHVLHLTITPSSTVNETASACDSYTWPYNNITYYASDVITVVEGCVSHVLHLTITPSSTVNETASACDSYTWPYNNTTYYASDVITVVDGCVSHVLHLTITPSSTVNETASACDSYTWPYNNTTYYASDVITVVDGCVSHVLHLTITPSSTVNETASACDSYTWPYNNITYYASDVITVVDGCVSHVLHLTITPSSTVNETASACDSYTWPYNNTTYYASDVITVVDGCVSHVLHLTITPSSTVNETASACDSYTWPYNNITYYASDVITVVEGCVSHVLHLTITPSSTVNETASACDSYTWPYNNITYYASDVITVVEGCVSHVLHLTITPSSTVNETASACDSYTWPYNNTTYYASDVITVVDGCVSHVLHLTITPSSTVNETASACDSYTWPYNNITYYASDVITVVDGCVSHVLHLTITPSSTVNETASACDSYTWPYNNTTYYASDVITVVDGCVSHVLHLTITPSSTVSETASACDSYTWPYNNTTYYASDVITVVDGCVSHVLHLTITPSSTVSETASACDSYTWPYNNTTYYASDVITVVDGCVSHVLHLTINTSSTVEETASACDSYTWPYNNTTYYATDNITVVDGCGTHILHLTITPSSTVSETASACDSYTWPYNNTTYFASDVITVLDGCVSHVLHLTINPTVNPTFAPIAAICAGESIVLPATSIEGVTGTWAPAVNNLATTTYTFTPTAGLCATTAIMNVVVNPKPTFTMVYSGATSVIQGSTSVFLPYAATTGTFYTIDWNAAAEAVGFQDVLTPTPIPVSPIVLAVPGGAPLGYYVGSIKVTNGLCESISYGISVSVVAPAFTMDFTQDIGTTMYASWTPIPGAGTYALQYRIGSGNWIGMSTGVTYAKMVNLLPGQNYECKVKAYALNGAPMSTSVSTFHTTAVVTYVSTYDIGTTCLVRWNDDLGPWISSYVFQYKKNGTTTWSSISSTNSEIKLSNLTPNTKYDCQIAVYKAGKLWGNTQLGFFTTDKVVFTVNPLASTSATLNWNFPDRDIVPAWITSYVVSTYFNSNPWVNVSVAYPNNSKVFSSLLPGTVYHYKLSVYKGGVLWGTTQDSTFITPTAKGNNTDNLGDNSNEVNIYPNPFVDKINMDLFSKEGTNVSWKIYDITGKVVLTGRESISGGYSTINIDAAGLSKGVYMLNAIMNDQIQSFRIMKQ